MMANNTLTPLDPGKLGPLVLVLEITREETEKVNESYSLICYDLINFNN
tara:strand:- start:44578 stop:44724 length:147 start_codon:yes stop_codon:yes gene_type:complete